MKSIPIKSTPLRLFGKPEDSDLECALRRSESVKEVSSELAKYYGGRKTKHPKSILRYLSIFPEVCESHSAGIVNDEESLNSIRQSAASVFYTIIGDYEVAAPILERELITQGNGEYIVALLDWGLNNNQALRHSTNDFFSILMEDPFQARRAEVLLRKNGCYGYAQKISKMTIQWCHENKNRAAAAAYIYVSSCPSMRLRDYVRLIRLNAFYAFRGLITLRDRHFSCYDMDYSRISPRWAYHILRVGIDRIDEDAFRDILYKDPAWTVEYLCDSDTIKDKKATMIWLQEAYEASDGHPLQKHLLNWTKGLSNNGAS